MMTVLEELDSGLKTEEVGGINKISFFAQRKGNPCSLLFHSASVEVFFVFSAFIRHRVKH
jgi:hypothetical protein